LAGKVTAGLAESNGSVPPGGWFKATCMQLILSRVGLVGSVWYRFSLRVKPNRVWVRVRWLAIMLLRVKVIL